ncbi:hypothetical protein L9F63_017311 [Diploptera punctata]|uniref:Uncharacterized protein n=1 Tax=Diploptera punctata TaxID=6984 RepID=A0AAD7ZZ84_DIPPU|nr:hypothetical protein L9F63_017311 [Diploptera punctata]
MTAIISNRKRVRSNNCDEECCDFMPLSKRINNLHINNGNCYSGIGYQHSMSDQAEMYEGSSEAWGCMDPREECLELNGGKSLHPSYSDGNGCHSIVQPASDTGTSQPHAAIESPPGTPDVQTANWIDSRILSQYTPDLNATDNPYYYENNKLLFALYMERLHRNGSALY